MSATGTLSCFLAGKMNDLFAGLERQAVQEALEEGFDETAVKLNRLIDLRYPHQGYALGVECPDGEIRDVDKADIKSAFDAYQHITVWTQFHINCTCYILLRA